jgi:hypothetical protein
MPIRYFPIRYSQIRGAAHVLFLGSLLAVALADRWSESRKASNEKSETAAEEVES